MEGFFIYSASVSEAPLKEEQEERGVKNGRVNNRCSYYVLEKLEKPSGHQDIRTSGSKSRSEGRDQGDPLEGGLE